MRTSIRIIILVAILTFLVSCKSEIKGDEPAIKNLVVELIEEHMKDELVLEIIIGHFNVSPHLWGYPTYSELEAMPESPEANLIVSQIDSLFTDLIFSVHNIRVTKKDKDLNRVKCSAELYLNNAPVFDIQYTAQKTTDSDKIYVELLNINEK